ncbi:MAG: hypothetical protein CVU84_06025 [Firmicutes bacterium HGW-Firmicutes-1]|jgi:PAS domain S-box-containing protein|nr:MAG: hypothetical protein CVU84_06025 [Firmicutes bacterium HGW-Firmicutes-1]
MENRDIKILAIDDNQDNLISLKALLRDAFPKCVVFTATNGQKGLELAIEVNPDVILLDIIMPVMDGFETCRRLKLDSWVSEIPVVFLTAIKQDKESRILALECGAEAFLAKPIDESELTAQIRAMLKIKNANLQKRDEKERLARLVEEKTFELKRAHMATLQLLEDRKQMEQELRIREEKYRLIAENVSDVIWILNLSKNKTTYVSPSILQLRGLTVEEALNETMEETLVPDSLAMAKDEIAKHMNDFIEMPEEPKHYIIEVQQFCKNGDIIWVEMSTKYRYNLDGDIEMVGVIRNIEERKLTEDARIQAEAASFAKSNFLANISHEIRTPINAIIGFNYLIQKTQLSSIQLDYVEKTILSAQNLLDLVNDVLDISKIEANKITLEYNLFDLYEVLNNVSNIVSYNLCKKKLTLHYRLNSEIPQFLIGDAVRFNQVLLNLINNSVKFTEKGEINIILEMENMSEKQITLRIIVEDTGIGMSQEYQSNLFDAFTQGDMSTTRKYGGTGLGLSISKSLIELMGGTIYVESKLGQGSRFVFTAQFERDYEAKVKDHTYANLEFLKVLLVGGKSDMTSIIMKELNQFDIKHKQVESISDAIHALHEKKDYHLVLIDWQLLKDKFIQKISKVQDALGTQSFLMILSAYREYELETIEYDDCVNGIFYYPMGQLQFYKKLAHIFDKHLEKNLISNETFKLQDQSKFHNAKVLLVEDNEINQELARAILEENGININIADNGSMALEMVKKEKYDLILMDLQMPVMDGYEAARKIRSLDDYKEIPIIAMSAHALIGIKEKVYEAGMNDYISKPFEVLKMINTLNGWLNKIKSK